MYEVYIGCEEWQETEDFETLDEARIYIEGWRKEKFSMGAYTATQGWIRNDHIDFYEEVDISW